MRRRTPQPDGETNAQMLKRAISHSTTGQFEKVMLVMVAHQTKLKEVEVMRSVFEALDTEANGSLSMDEIRAGAKRCSQLEGITEETLQELFKSLDLNDNQSVN